MQHRILALGSVVLTACTTLGPMPATTGVSAIPANRPGGEVQAAVMPVFYLSEATQEAPHESSASPQLAGLFEPDRLLGTKGLILGARTWGGDGDTPIEPMIGYRRRLDERFAVAGIAYGTIAHGEGGGAYYDATRLGGELAVDALLIPMGDYLGLHFQATVAATYINASGRYCVESNGIGTDCDDYSREVNGEIEGIYTSATAGGSLDIARRPHGVFHGVKLAFLGAVGAMPKLRDGIQAPSKETYKSFGLLLTVGLGSDH